jgi:uncharacterized RDD family membrane protein YckC
VEALGLPASGPGSIAPVGRRLGAFVIDAFASAAIAGLFVRHRSLPGVAAHLPGFWSLVPLAVDYLAGLTLVGQTLGMRLLGLRVIRTDRPARIGLGPAAIRTFLLFLLVPALVFDRANRGLHDRVSDTLVVTA